MVAQAGRVRDSVVYSIVRAEWPAVRASLVARIAAFEPPTVKPPPGR